MTAKPGSDEGEPGGGAPRGGSDPIDALLTASDQIISATEEAALDDAVAQAMRSFGVDSYCLSSIHDGAERYVKVISSRRRGVRPSAPEECMSPLLDDPVLASVASGAPLIVEEGAAREQAGDGEAIRRFMDRTVAQAFSLFPRVEGRRVKGSLTILHDEPHPRSEGEVRVLRLLAQVMSSSLLKIESRAHLARRMKQLSELYRIGEVISRQTDEATLFQTAATRLASEIHYLNCWIGVVDEEAGVLREVGHAGVGIDRAKPPLAFPLDDPSIMVIASLRGGEPVAYSWLQERADAEGWGHIARAANLNSGVYVPLRAEGEVFGLMTVASPDREVSDGEVALLGAFGNQLGDAVVRLRLNKERSQKVAELEAAYADQARLLETVRQLSTPVIPVHDGVLVVPLVGMVDASRSAMIMESLLHAIQKERASVVILDITGVPAVDAGVAGHIVRSVRAASLLGAECVLVGVSPAVAHTLVELGVELGALVTRRNLQSGISYALDVMGQATR